MSIHYLVSENEYGHCNLFFFFFFTLGICIIPLLFLCFYEWLPQVSPSLEHFYQDLQSLCILVPPQQTQPLNSSCFQAIVILNYYSSNQSDVAFPP